MKSSAAVVLVLVAGLGLAGCGSSSSADPKTPVSSATDPSPTATGDSGITAPPVENQKVPQFKGKATGIISDTMVTSCTTAKGTVKASGTVTNSLSKSDPAQGVRDIAITMAWTNQATSDLLARGFAVLPNVKAGATVDWSITTTLKSDVPAICVPTAQRGILKTKG